jgi:uncharacterized alpha-E superfamily protein
MLSRTANDLYWMSRYMERAENTARMLDITYRMSLMPYRVLEPGQEWAEPWAVPLVITGMVSAYYETNTELSSDNVLRFMVLDARNPSSIYACLQAAREAARSQRGALTSEMWESLNDTWLEVRPMDFAAITNRGVQEFFDWVKMRSHLLRGVTFGTMLRDEAFLFHRLGTYMERADNTARLLDVKYHILLPSVSDVGGAVDYYQWSALLRSLSGFQAYRKIYRDLITPLRVAELLILRDDMPRSLHACMNFVHEILSQVGNAKIHEPERLAGEIHAQLHYGRIEQIMAHGLHEYLTQFLGKIGTLGEEINRHFLTPVYA